MPGQASNQRDRILMLLKGRGSLTAQELAEEIGISAVAVRRHLAMLEGGGLVDRGVRREHMGRPAHAYTLTQQASCVFPQAYRELALEILEGLVAGGSKEQVRGVFRTRDERMKRRYEASLSGQSLSERMKELARLRDEDGYMATFEGEDGSLVIRENNCPIYDVASRHPEACQSEEDLFRKLLGDQVTHRRTLIGGAPVCEYRVEGQGSGDKGQGDNGQTL